MCLILAVSGCGKVKPEIISDYGSITEQTVSESVKSKNENMIDGSLIDIVY